MTSQVEAKRYLFYSENIVEDEWPAGQFSKKVQSGQDLGERMNNAFESALKEHERVIIIGSDCPAITNELIEMAFQRLEIADVVIGPSKDSGYYLLGMKERHSSIFQNVDWSTDKVLPQTIEHIKKLGLLYNLLPELNDIDTLEDLKEFPELIPTQLSLTS